MINQGPTIRFAHNSLSDLSPDLISVYLSPLSILVINESESESKFFRIYNYRGMERMYLGLRHLPHRISGVHMLDFGYLSFALTTLHLFRSTLKVSYPHSHIPP